MATIFYPTIIGDVSPNQVAAKLGDADDATALAAAKSILGVATPLSNVEEFSDATYRYYLGDTATGWQVNRETRALPWVRTVATGTDNKPTDLATCQAEF